MIDFPNSPVTDQEFTDGNGTVWLFNGEMWYRIGDAGGGSAKLVNAVIDSTQVIGSTTAGVGANNAVPPPNTEGTEWQTVTIQPDNAANILDIEFQAMVDGTNGARRYFVSLYRDSIVDAIASVNVRPTDTNNLQAIALRYSIAAGSTAATTFKIRYGPQAGDTMYINQTSNGTFWGSVMPSTLSVKEYLP